MPEQDFTVRPKNAPAQQPSMVPAGYAEKAMATLMQLHSELMDEKERRVETYRQLMEAEQTIAELRLHVRLLEERLAASGHEPIPRSVAPMRALPKPPPPPVGTSAPKRLRIGPGSVKAAEEEELPPPPVPGMPVVRIPNPFRDAQEKAEREAAQRAASAGLASSESKSTPGAPASSPKAAAGEVGTSGAKLVSGAPAGSGLKIDATPRPSTVAGSQTQGSPAASVSGQTPGGQGAGARVGSQTVQSTSTSAVTPASSVSAAGFIGNVAPPSRPSSMSTAISGSPNVKVESGTAAVPPASAKTSPVANEGALDVPGVSPAAANAPRLDVRPPVPPPPPTRVTVVARPAAGPDLARSPVVPPVASNGPANEQSPRPPTPPAPPTRVQLETRPSSAAGLTAEPTRVGASLKAAPSPGSSSADALSVGLDAAFAEWSKPTQSRGSVEKPAASAGKSPATEKAEASGAVKAQAESSSPVTKLKAGAAPSLAAGGSGGNSESEANAKVESGVEVGAAAAAKASASTSDKREGQAQASPPSASTARVPTARDLEDDPTGAKAFAASYRLKAQLPAIPRAHVSARSPLSLEGFDDVTEPSGATLENLRPAELMAMLENELAHAAPEISPEGADAQPSTATRTRAATPFGEGFGPPSASSASSSSTSQRSDVPPRQPGASDGWKSW